MAICCCHLINATFIFDGAWSKSRQKLILSPQRSRAISMQVYFVLNSGDFMRKRGPYKQYLCDATARIPRTTLWKHRVADKIAQDTENSGE